MPLYYYLVDNKLTNANADDRLARTTHPITRSREEAIEAMTQSGSILKETECRAVLEAFFNTLHGYFEKGEAYRDADFAIYHRISGIFADDNDRFDANRHTISYGCSLGSRFRNTAASISPVHKKAPSSGPVVSAVFDVLANSQNNKLSPGGVLEITGTDLKLYDHAAGQGVFFVDQGSGDLTEATRVHNNEPTKLSVVAPVLDAGTYKVEIRNTTRAGKELRIFTYAQVLTVDT